MHTQRIYYGSRTVCLSICLSFTGISVPSAKFKCLVVVLWVPVDIFLDLYAWIFQDIGRYGSICLPRSAKNAPMVLDMITNSIVCQLLARTDSVINRATYMDSL